MEWNLEVLVPVILSIALAIWNLFQQWKLNALKENSEKSIQIHRIQFEKEFEIYDVLWAKLIELRNIATQLRPHADSHPKEMTYDEVIENRLEQASRIGNEVLLLYQKNKPFYSSSVYDSLSVLITAVRNEILDVKFGDRKTREYWEQGQENIPKLIDLTEDVCIEIRTRIGTLE